MILHKLIFFRLPYRWAAYGDHPGLYGSDTASPTEDDDGKGNDNDMDRLEREVSSYPGFKSMPRLETLFTSRRLPRSYLVLLESLLNVAPAARPSCEKVLAALHLGKVTCFFSPSLFYHHSCVFIHTNQTFAVQPHSAEIEHVRPSRAQGGTVTIGRCRHLLVDTSPSRTYNNDDDIPSSSFVPYAAATAPVATFRAK